MTADFLAFLLRHLSPRGVAIVSSHGAFVAGRIQASVLQGGEGYGTENGTARCSRTISPQALATRITPARTSPFNTTGYHS